MARVLTTDARDLVAPAGYWRHSIIVAYVLILVVAVRLHEFVPATAALSPVLLGSVLGGALLASKTPPATIRSALAHPISKLAIAYLAWATLTVPFALWPTLAFNTARGLLPCVLMLGVMLLCPPNRRSLDRLQTAFVAMVLIYSSYAQVFGRFRGGRLLAGGMYDSNDMAALLALAFPMAAGLMARSVPGRARTIAILAVLGLIGGVVASGSRGGTLALVVGAIVFALGFRGARGALAIAAMVALGIVGWVTASPQFRERMMTLSNLEEDYNYRSPTGRKAVWERGRSYIVEHPVVGVGAGNFPIAEGGRLEDIGQTGKWSAAHNAYIQAFAELGLLGGSIFVGLLLVAAFKSVKMWRARMPVGGDGRSALNRPELLGSIAAFAAGAYFLSHAYFPAVFVLLGLTALSDQVRTAEAGMAFVRPVAHMVNRQRSGERGGLALVPRVLPPQRP